MLTTYSNFNKMSGSSENVKRKEVNNTFFFLWEIFFQRITMRMNFPHYLNKILPAIISPLFIVLSRQSKEFHVCYNFVPSIQKFWSRKETTKSDDELAHYPQFFDKFFAFHLLKPNNKTENVGKFLVRFVYRASKDISIPWFFPF